MSQHCAQLELLSLVMDHEATPGEEQEWHSHLQGCASCQKAAQALGQWRPFEAVPVQLPQNFPQQVVQRYRPSLMKRLSSYMQELRQHPVSLLLSKRKRAASWRGSLTFAGVYTLAVLALLILRLPDRLMVVHFGTCYGLLFGAAALHLAWEASLMAELRRNRNLEEMVNCQLPLSYLADALAYYGLASLMSVLLPMLPALLISELALADYGLGWGAAGAVLASPVLLLCLSYLGQLLQLSSGPNSGTGLRASWLRWRWLVPSISLLSLLFWGHQQPGMVALACLPVLALSRGWAVEALAWCQQPTAPTAARQPRLFATDNAVYQRQMVRLTQRPGWIWWLSLAAPWLVFSQTTNIILVTLSGLPLWMVLFADSLTSITKERERGSWVTLVQSGLTCAEFCLGWLGAALRYGLVPLTSLILAQYCCGWVNGAQSGLPLASLCILPAGLLIGLGISGQCSNSRQALVQGLLIRPALTVVGLVIGAATLVFLVAPRLTGAWGTACGAFFYDSSSSWAGVAVLLLMLSGYQFRLLTREFQRLSQRPSKSNSLAKSYPWSYLPLDLAAAPLVVAFSLMLEHWTQILPQPLQMSSIGAPILIALTWLVAIRLPLASLAELLEGKRSSLAFGLCAGALAGLSFKVVAFSLYALPDRRLAQWVDAVHYDPLITWGGLMVGVVCGFLCGWISFRGVARDLGRQGQLLKRLLASSLASMLILLGWQQWFSSAFSVPIEQPVAWEKLCRASEVRLARERPEEQNLALQELMKLVGAHQVGHSRGVALDDVSRRHKSSGKTGDLASLQQNLAHFMDRASRDEMLRFLSLLQDLELGSGPLAENAEELHDRFYSMLLGLTQDAIDSRLRDSLAVSQIRFQAHSKDRLQERYENMIYRQSQTFQLPFLRRMEAWSLAPVPEPAVVLEFRKNSFINMSLARLPEVTSDLTLKRELMGEERCRYVAVVRLYRFECGRWPNTMEQVLKRYPGPPFHNNLQGESDGAELPPTLPGNGKPDKISVGSPYWTPRPGH